MIETLYLFYISIGLLNMDRSTTSQPKPGRLEQVTTWFKANWMQLLGGLFVVLSFWLFVKMVVPSKSEFYNPNAIRRYVIGQSGDSLDDRIVAASKSTLTGTRDVPVFYQDLGSQLVRSDDGTMQREVVETLAGDKSDAIDALEKKLMLAE